MIPQLQREAPLSAPEQTTSWRLSTRIAFRFIFAYFILYVYPRAVGSLGAFINYSNPLRTMWHAVVPWVGANLLHISGDITEVANGSGDQVYDYVLLLCIAMAAGLITIVWSVVDRKRTEYRVLYEWLRLFMRLTVAVAMISYGANKIFRMQFPEPYLAWLVGSYSQSSPMRLLWTFMGMSRGYSFFAGCAEMLGGLLLIVPRFTTLGSLVTLAVMGNVLMLNLFYDVPRKIYSIHLVLFALFLLIPDIRKLIDFFLLDRPAQLTSPPPLFNDKMLNSGVLLLQLVIGAGALIVCSNQAYHDAVKAATHLPPPLRGIWVVDEFLVDGQLRPPLLTDSDRWQRVIFDNADEINIQSMDGSLNLYLLQMTPGNPDFTFWPPNDPGWKAQFTLDTPRSDQMTLSGQLSGHHVNVTMHRMDMSDPTQFLLTNRGIHWINDFPLRK